jgi:ubiquinone biosynthesis accessory factor UbiJ
MEAVDGALTAVAALLNHALEFDADAQARVEALQGRDLEIAVEGTHLRIRVEAIGPRLHLATAAEHPAAVRISGPPASLAALSGREGVRVLFAGDLRVEGDVTAARAWKRLFDTLEPDWEEAVARIAGDIPAHEVGRAAAALAAWARRMRAHRSADLRAWLVNELEILPARHELDTWSAGVDRGRHDVERLAARVTRLERLREES